MAATTTPVPDITVNSTVSVTVTVTVLYEKEFYSTCIL